MPFKETKRKCKLGFNPCPAASNSIANTVEDVLCGLG